MLSITIKQLPFNFCQLYIISKLGYPYSYGDEGGSFPRISKQTKVIVFSLLIGTPVLLGATNASAANPDEILTKIEKALNELDGSSRTTRGILPVGSISCIISGVCMAQAKSLFAQGNLQGAAALACGGDIIAAYHGF